MSNILSIKEQLDALLGADRNGKSGMKDIHFTDSKVCKFFLAGLCPNELFINTVCLFTFDFIVLVLSFSTFPSHHRNCTLELAPRYTVSS
jgi:hypothetical protein